MFKQSPSGQWDGEALLDEALSLRGKVSLLYNDTAPRVLI